MFIVGQPKVSELETLYKSSIQNIIVENTSLKTFRDEIHSTGPEFRNYIEKVFGIDIKTKYKENWISGDKIENFIEEKKKLVKMMFVVSAMTLMYKNEVMHYGKFNGFGKTQNM